MNFTLLKVVSHYLWDCLSQATKVGWGTWRRAILLIWPVRGRINAFLVLLIQIARLRTYLTSTSYPFQVGHRFASAGQRREWLVGCLIAICRSTTAPIPNSGSLNLAILVVHQWSPSWHELDEPLQKSTLIRAGAITKSCHLIPSGLSKGFEI